MCFYYYHFFGEIEMYIQEKPHDTNLSFENFLQLMMIDNDSLWNCHNCRSHDSDRCVVNDIGRSVLSTTPDSHTGLTKPAVRRTICLYSMVMEICIFRCFFPRNECYAVAYPYAIWCKRTIVTWLYRRWKPRNPAVISFDTYQRVTDRRTDRHRARRYTRHNKNLAIANRSCVSCVHNTSRAYIKSKCIPSLLYGFNACALTKSELSSLDYIVNRFLWSYLKLIILMLLKVVNYISDSACQVRNGWNEQRI